jgi:SAM-dependent methyltransferase
MGWYREQLLPRIQNRVMARPPLNEVRARVCEGLTGDVVEVGFGTGLNARYYPATVDRVFAVEPSSVCMRLAQPRIAGTSIPVKHAGLSGERLDLPSARFDAALSTWTFCTIPNLARALDELRRVLKTGARLHFVEHGHAPDPEVQRWQRRVEPTWKHVAGGCHLTRRITDEIEAAGFEIESLDRYYLDGEPRLLGWTFEGRAVRH